MTQIDETISDVRSEPADGQVEDHEVIVIGAGVGGIYQIKRLTDLGIDAIVLERESGLGGTWYRNRYPGARFDSESYSYGYSFSQELLDEWDWSERFTGQPENLRYLQYVADKFDLEQYMVFDALVESMVFDEHLFGDERPGWTVTLTDGRTYRAQTVITCIGLISTPTLPRIEGTETFDGPSFHTFEWPNEQPDLAGKRVGVIGTGATGIQVIAAIADQVGELTVFQRRPNWSAPLNNAPIDSDEMDDIRDRYDEIFDTCARTPGGFLHEPDRRGFWNVSREERVATWDRLYEESGFAIWLRNFTEIFIDEAANQEFSEYIADRIRQRVDDPAIAEQLIPRDHGFGVQRVPMESNYFEVYNRDNVRLVDVTADPIERVTPAGIRTGSEEFDLDIIVYATGFDAITGAFDQIDIVGTDGRTLRDDWRNGPETYLGVLMHGYPNLMMVSGPQSGSASTNFPRAIETSVDWVTGLIAHVRDEGIERFEATSEAQEGWVAHIEELYSMMLLRKAKSWFTGYNSNVEGHEEGTFRLNIYNGGSPKYAKEIAEAADAGYEGIETA